LNEKGITSFEVKTAYGDEEEATNDQLEPPISE
jgi:hypothetical protein